MRTPDATHSLATPRQGDRLRSSDVTAMRAASLARDYGRVIQLARKAARISQAELAAACGLTQSAVSRMERRGTGTYDMQHLGVCAGALGIAPQLLGLAGAAITIRTEDEVNRRRFLVGASALTAATIAPSALGPQTEDAQASTVRVITAGYRRLDATAPSRQLIDPVKAHLRMVQELAQATRDPESRSRMAAAGSEVASFAAWLSWDMGDHGSARVWYGNAVTAARHAGDPLLTAYQAGSFAELEAEAGSTAEAFTLIRSARRQLGNDRPSIAGAWLLAREAHAHAAAGNEQECARALDACEATTATINADERAPWPWVFTWNPAKVAAARVACGARLGRSDWVHTALPSVAHSHRKQHALLTLDVASAHLAERQLDAAVMLASQALDVGIDTKSGRVLDGARQFRRRIKVASPPQSVRAFDERLHSVYL